MPKMLHLWQANFFRQQVFLLVQLGHDGLDHGAATNKRSFRRSDGVCSGGGQGRPSCVSSRSRSAPFGAQAPIRGPWRRPMRNRKRFHAVCAGALIAGLAVACAQQSPVRRITQTEATSDCIGDPRTPMCAVETFVACFTRRDTSLCRKVGVGNVYLGDRAVAPGRYKRAAEAPCVPPRISNGWRLVSIYATLRYSVHRRPAFAGGIAVVPNADRGLRPCPRIRLTPCVETWSR